jgi:hypothetical protein
VTRILLELVALASIGGLIYELRRTILGIERPPPSALARPPLDFKLVEESYDLVPPGASRAEVERLLGPPTHRNIGESDFPPELRSRLRHLVYEVQFWDKWIDPKDEHRWVLIRYVQDKGYQGRVYGKLKKGF